MELEEGLKRNLKKAIGKEINVRIADDVTAIGTLVDIIHKKNVKYFFENAKKAKLSATKELGAGERAGVIIKTVVNDIATTAELGAGKRRVAHILGMYGTVLFWVASVVMIFWFISSQNIPL